MPYGDQVSGQVTLDNCGFDFTTEVYRVARRQYVVLNSAGADAGLSNEVVAYDTAAHAAEALGQWRTSVAKCPHTPVRSSVQGVPATRYTVISNVVGSKDLPTGRNTVTVESGTPSGQASVYLAAIQQVHGRVLDSIYMQSTQPITATELTALITLAKLTGTRLAAAE